LVGEEERQEERGKRREAREQDLAGDAPVPAIALQPLIPGD
jgi:hypothetical protein